MIIARAARVRNNIMKSLLSHAANPMKPYAGYGSIDKGIEVINYRSTRKQFYINSGLNNHAAYIKACEDTIQKYGVV